jgi:GNAT superfamily N-acetyltransferase
MTLQVRKAEDEDIPRIMLLFNSYTTPPKSAYFFQWWNNIPSITFCAVFEKKIVGLFVVLKRKLINNLNCGVLMGLIVEKEWRGSGLFRELGNKAMNYYEDIDLFCCLTNSVGKKALEKNFNFRTIDNIETMTLAGNVNTDCHDYICTPITSNTKFNNFKMGKEDTVMFLADEEFRQWRFALHPRYEYSMIRKDSDEFVVINKYCDKETNMRYGDIVDFETEALEEGRLVNLFNDAYLSLAKDVDMVTIQAIPKSLLHGVGQKMGFVESNLRHYFCVKVKEPCNEYLYNASKWLIKWGDYLR